jgi:glycosyltransferase involved in cell wall biosynthesis
VRICIIGKFPPIQGGVSTRTYWSAHDLASRGHDVHVVTNAKEARAPFRMLMRQQDWQRCEATYGTGSVTVHWSDPVDRSQNHIPMASPFVSKLASIATRVHSERPFDVIYSHYIEPYGVAGHLAAEMTRVPHVVRMAGSDAGRLWHHPQLETLYDHVLRSAETVIAGMATGRAIKHGVEGDRIVTGGGSEAPADLFGPDGLALDLAALRGDVEADPEFRDLLWGGLAGELPCFGIYGKLGETKGSFALLAAMQRLKEAGIAVGLLAMAHGWPGIESRFRSRAQELGLADRILQIPFLPHWRVPEFLRSCIAVCCLEQDFPIVFHTPVIAREVLMCGTCLVGSSEVIRKLPDYSRVPDGYGCVAIEDIQDVEALSAKLAAIATDREPIASVAARGRIFARKAQAAANDPDRLERLLKSAARRRSSRRGQSPVGTTEADPRFPIAQLAARTLEEQSEIGRTSEAHVLPRAPIDLPRARDILAAAEKNMASSDLRLAPVASAIRLEIAIAEAETATSTERPTENLDPLFRLRTRRWALIDGDLAALVPLQDPRLRMMTFDAAELAQCRSGPIRPEARRPRLRHVVAFAQNNGARREPLFISDETARILQLSDGTRTALEIAAELASGETRAGIRRRLRLIEELFVAGLLWLQEEGIDRIPAARLDSIQAT